MSSLGTESSGKQRLSGWIRLVLRTQVSLGVAIIGKCMKESPAITKWPCGAATKSRSRVSCSVCFSFAGAADHRKLNRLRCNRPSGKNYDQPRYPTEV